MTVYPMIERYEMEEEAESGSDFLVKNNNEQVKAEQLAGKVVAICFFPLSVRSDTLHQWTDSLMDVYNNCQVDNSFEIVFVAATEFYDVRRQEIVLQQSLDRDSEKRFEYMFSCMPWTAIPFFDITSRKRLQRSFAAEVRRYTPAMFVIESTGRVFKLSLRMLNVYGALGIPFSDKKVKYLEAQDDAIARQPSLNALLASPQRDYVILNKGDKAESRESSDELLHHVSSNFARWRTPEESLFVNHVPIHTLEDKVVGLYFFEEDYTAGDLTEGLKTAYERLAVEQNFEIVFIYLSDTPQTRQRTSEKTFWKHFETMPWLALPFKDSNSKVLKRVLEYPSVEYCAEEEPPNFVIFGPHGEFIEPFGTSILFRYGTKAYPFTRNVAC
ncbi:hypothetical protein AgCh_017700 [Apium graveolens]